MPSLQVHQTLTTRKDSPMKHPNFVALEQVVLSLGRHGFSYKLMMERTGEERGTLYRILKTNKVKLADYRNGESSTARNVMQGLELPRIRRTG